MKKILIAIAALSFALSSCDSFLEEKVKGQYTQENFYANVNELNYARTGLYFLFGHAALRSYEGFEGRFASPDDNFGANYSTSLMQCEINASYNPEIDKDAQLGWERCYNAINAANAIINKAPEIDVNGEKDPTSAAKTVATTIAEAKFVRAYMNFWMLKFFNSFPLILDSYNVDANREVRNAHSDEIYALVLEDLEEAESVLPEKWDNALYANAGCFTKVMAQAFLSKVYLQLAGYPNKGNIPEKVNGEQDAYKKCAEWAKKVIDYAPAHGIGLRTHYWEEFDSYWRPNSQPVEENIIWVDRNNEEDYSTRRPKTARPIDINGWEGVSVECGFFQKMPQGERRDFTFVTHINTQVPVTDKDKKPIKDENGNVVTKLTSYSFMETQAKHPRYRKFWADTTP